MMDRFKFRLFVTENEAYPDKVGYVNEESFCILPNGEESFFDADYDFAECIVEQCTGLKDKNGKLIYEGDICIPAKDMADRAGEVYRAESGAYFIKGRMKNGMEYDFGIYWHHYMYEVIGNIHENKELLDD
jgi:uncharacterized phage protein (TIGR01671 family)